MRRRADEVGEEHRGRLPLAGGLGAVGSRPRHSTPRRGPAGRAEARVGRQGCATASQAASTGVPQAGQKRVPGSNGVAQALQFIEVPAQAVLEPRPLGHEVLAVVDEEADLALGTVEQRDRQVGFTERRPGDRQGVDGIALAGFATTSAGHRP